MKISLHNLKRTFIVIVGLCFAITVSAQSINIIPWPRAVVKKEGQYCLTDKVSVLYNSQQLTFQANYTTASIKRNAGLQLQSRLEPGKAGQKGAINLLLDPQMQIGSEGYMLDANADNITIKASTAKGIFYGVQSLLQLITAEKTIPAVVINDEPRFSWRGLLLDPARHFLPFADLKRMVDQMAVYKYNLLQLHLTDDQGWRLEIKSLPKLTEVGAWRVPRVGLWWHRKAPMAGEAATDGGFYTQEQMKDLIQYALDRNIQILPEIEMPGHSLAAIAAYPYLSSTQARTRVNPGSTFYTLEDNALCVGKDTTFEYVDKVLTEVAALFPFEYIHIGGDECYKGFWKLCQDCQKSLKDNNVKDELGLQSYFIKRVEKLLDAKGKRMIGWDEILEGGLAPKATVMSWRGTDGGIAAAKENHHIVMCPSASTYLDFIQGTTPGEPAGGGLLRLKTAYEFEPVPAGVDPALVLGSQGNLWGEYVPTFRHAEYMLWPRSLALAEVFWTPKELKNWNEFTRRMEVELTNLDKADINYARCAFDAMIATSKDKDGKLLIELSTEIENVDIFYTFDNTIPDHHSPLYKRGDKLSVPLSADNFKYVTYKNGVKVGKFLIYPLVPEI